MTLTFRDIRMKEESVLELLHDIEGFVIDVESELAEIKSCVYEIKQRIGGKES